MRTKNLKKLRQNFYGTDCYINAFIEYLEEHRDIAKYISLKDAKILINKNLHFSPYLEELQLLMKISIPQKYVASIMLLRSSFVDTSNLEGKEFFEYVLQIDPTPSVNLPIMATVNKKIGYFHPSLSLKTIIKVISVATFEEAFYIFYSLNKDSDFPDLYYSFDEYIKDPSTSPSQAYVLLEDYARLCNRVEAGLEKEVEKILPDVFFETYFEDLKV